MRLPWGPTNVNMQRDRAAVRTENYLSTAASAPRPEKKRTGFIAQLRYKLLRLILPMKETAPPNGATPTEAVTSFLNAMSASAARNAPVWERMLRPGLYDCGLTYDQRHAFFDSYPVGDYYFAGIVAMEVVRVRRLFRPAEANALLAEIGGRVDAAAHREDRVVSELVFEVMSRITMSQGPTLQKMPYDVVVKAILEQLDIAKNEATRPLMSDKAFRHGLGEPLAVSFSDWWTKFQKQFVLYLPPEEIDESDDEEEFVPAADTSAPAKRPWRPRRAKTF